VITLSNIDRFSHLLQSERESNFEQNPCNISHLTLTLVPHYLEKINRLIYRKKTTAFQPIVCSCWTSRLSCHWSMYSVCGTIYLHTLPPHLLCWHLGL